MTSASESVSPARLIRLKSLLRIRKRRNERIVYSFFIDSTGLALDIL